jgi:parallel beta-helix repeat protein
MKGAAGCAVAVLLLAGAAGVAADTSEAGALYVSPDGDDANPGTKDEPLRTIQKAGDVAEPGTTVHVGPGDYPGEVLLETAGTPDAWITFVSDTRHAAVVTGEMNLNAEYVRIEGFDITGPESRDGLEATASNIVIRDNRFYDIHKFDPNDNGGSGLTIYTDDYEPLENVVIDRNQVFDIGLSPGDNQLVQGIYISVPCPDCTITNNLVHNVADFGIHAYHNPQYWLVANNTVFNNGRGILTGPDFTVINNISVDNGEINYDVRGDAEMSNNLSYGDGSEEMQGVTVDDPRFVDYQSDGSGDYHLADDSPGLDGGTGDGAPDTDLEGAERPQGDAHDIGAYEQ